MIARYLDPIEAVIVAGAVQALRRRAQAIRKRASSGVTVFDGYRPVVVVLTSESAHAYRTARDFDSIASELEAERSEVTP